jgi:hypothetical protein
MTDDVDPTGAQEDRANTATVKATSRITTSLLSCMSHRRATAVTAIQQSLARHLTPEHSGSPRHVGTHGRHLRRTICFLLDIPAVLQSQLEALTRELSDLRNDA